MSNDLVQKVAERFIQASAPIELKEVEGRLEVSGPYDKIQNLIPYLRGKLEYRGRDKTWWVLKEKMTPLKIKNLQKKVNEINGISGPDPVKVEESEEVKEARAEEVKKLFRRATHMQVPGLSFGLIPVNAVQLTGVLTDLRVSINKAGGDYGPEFSKFYPHLVKPVEFEKLLDEVEDQGRLVAQAIANLSSMLPRHFPNLKIDVGTNSKGYLFEISGKTYDLKDEIKKLVPVTFNSQGSFWYAPIHKVKEGQVKELIGYLEGEERERAEKWKAEQKPPAAERKRPNQKGDHCLDCGGWVGAGDGYLVNYYDSEPGDFVWKVKHKDPEDCAKVKAEVRIRNESARTKGEARKNLMLLCQKSEYYVQGTGHRPAGEEIYIDKHSIGYGGGTWVVIEPGENYFWYVKNNGADGDDWSRNNVMTGGAGAIGYRLPMTDEARILIDVAKDG
jgi:hypothetical protein